MIKKIAALCLVGFSSLSFAEVNTDINLLELKTGKSIKQRIIADEVGFGHVELTIEPSRLSPGDGKGVEVTDVYGNSVFFSIDDGYSAILWDNAVVASDNSFPLVLGEQYRFVLNVSNQNIKVSRLTSNGIDFLFSYNKTLTPPLSYKLVAQRSGAKFRNVLITSK